MGVKDSLVGDNGKFLLLALGLLVVSLIIVFAMNSGMYSPAGDLLESKSTYAQPNYVLEEDIDYSIVITTVYGDIHIDLFESLAPRNVNSMLFLIGERYYEGLRFHKVIKDFVAQAGDAKGDGTGDPGYFVERENLVNFKDYDVGMANASQFFVVLRNAPKEELNGKYSVVGRVSEGFAVLDSMQRVEVDKDYEPLNDILIKSILIQEKEY